MLGHKWELDFSDGEKVDCRTCGICGTTHQSRVEDAELIEKQRIRICVLLAELDLVTRHAGHTCKECGAVEGNNHNFDCPEAQD